MTTGTLQQLVYLQGLPAGGARAGGGRRARQLLGDHDAGPRGRAGGRDGARPARATRRWLGSPGRRAALAHAGLDAHRGDAPSTAGHGWRRWGSRTSLAATRGTVECDTVVFRADWIPDHELAVDRDGARPGYPRPRGGRGPALLPCRRVRGGQPAARRRAGRRRGPQRPPRGGRRWRRTCGAGWPAARTPIVCEPPLGWIAPNAWRLRRTRRRAAASPCAPLRACGRRGSQSNREGARSGRGACRAVPGRSASGRRVGRAVDAGGGPVRVRIAERVEAAVEHEERAESWRRRTTWTTARSAGRAHRGDPARVGGQGGRPGGAGRAAGRRRERARRTSRDRDAARVTPASRGGTGRPSMTTAATTRRASRQRTARACPARTRPRPATRTPPARTKTDDAGTPPRNLGDVLVLRGPVKAGVAALFAVGVLLLFLNPPSLCGAGGHGGAPRRRARARAAAGLGFRRARPAATRCRSTSSSGWSAQRGAGPQSRHRLSTTEFDLLVADAIDGLPADFQRLLDRTPVVVSHPAPRTARTVTTSATPSRATTTPTASSSTRTRSSATSGTTPSCSARR